MTALWILSALLIKHFVCDFCLQTPRMVADKAVYMARGGWSHAFDHFLGTLLALLLCGIGPIAFSLAVVDMLIHYHIDHIKAYESKKHNLTSSDRSYWIAMGADQLAHQLTYVLIVYLALNK